jgi:hypothetical protein
LRLKIAGLNIVAIDDAEVADSGAREQGRQRRASGAASNDCDSRCGKPLLAFGSDGMKEDLAGVPLGEFQQGYLLTGCVLSYYR